MTIRDIFRLTLAAIFLAAAPQKILNPADFAVSVESYLILPDLLINGVTLVLPWLEILLAMLLVCRVWMGATLILSNLLLIVFLGAIVSAHLRGINLDCGCFSSAGETTDDMRWYIIRDSAFLILGLATAWMEAKHGVSAEPTPESEPAPDSESGPESAA